ncbi:thiol-disulfide oxidoreductase DCC family protein [Celerinatantimonas yamalensis]|uniref:DUF393 domain-containing protein n=1 Tax=Celerinatantimonas yamalensis TaxID=559956 RepID=A0ABW9G7S1_9GAMM
MLTIFYDGQCPLCVREMQKLAQVDKRHQLQLVDLNIAHFSENYPYIDTLKASRILHAQTQTGEILLGLDATWAAWQQVDKHRWIRLLRWPVIGWFADVGYWFFARYRYRFSRLILGQKTCDELCGLPSKSRDK